jgi:hypothetical protein
MQPLHLSIAWPRCVRQHGDIVRLCAPPLVAVLGRLAPGSRLTESAKATNFEVQVNAALNGHDIGPFEPVDTVSGGYQAVCRRCGKSVWVGDSGVMYSLLGEECAVRLQYADSY